MALTSKTRYWTFLLYPDSCNPDYLQFLNELHIPVALSPLHDRDTNPDDTIKKAHIHVIVCFEGPTTYNNVLENICEPLKATIPKRVLSIRGMYRYLCHLDNPEKYQYNVDDIILLGDFKIELTDTEINNLKIEITKDIEYYDIPDYYTLCNYYINQGYFDNFKIVSSNTSFFKSYIIERRLHQKEETLQKNK